MPAFVWRADQAESKRLAWAFGLSLALHLLMGGTYEAGRKWGWWENWHWPAWLQSTRMLAQILHKKPPGQELSPEQIQAQRQPPLLFVDVNPDVATPEPPKDSQFYSDKSSHAANPDADKDTGAPKITGKQTVVVRTEDIPRTEVFPLQPTPPPTQIKEDLDELRPKPTFTPGDLSLGKPDPSPRNDTGQEEHARPRTLAEVKARQANNRLAGEAMKQDGGVKTHHLQPSFDVVASPFGAYDRALIMAVQQRWEDLLESRNWAADRTGKVTLKFHLNSDGTISELKMVENTVDLALAMLCQSAIKDPSPFRPWPSDMKRLIGANFRDITFTFYYY
jgi:hypothetical protein